jgi:nitroreductase
MDNLHKLIRDRRSSRNFTNKLVDDSVIRKIMDTARYYASPSNSQAIRLMKLNEHDLTIIKNQMESEKVSMLESDSLSKKDKRKINAYFRFSETMFVAPVCLAFGNIEYDSMGSWLDSKGLYVANETASDIALGIVLQNISLLAENEGLSVCIYTAPMFFLQNYNHNIFDFKLKGFIVIGYDDNNCEPIARTVVDEFYKINKM